MQIHEMAAAFKTAPAGARLRWATVSGVGDRTVDIAIAGSATVVPGVPRVGAYYPAVGDTVAVIVSGMDMLVLGMMEGGPGTGIVPASKLPTGAGQYTSYIFMRSATQPATPTGPDPTTWSDSPPAENGNPLWMSLATIALDGTLVGTWSTPVQIEGAAGSPGAPGADGASVSVEYSIDGSTSWHSIFNASADIYMHLKVGSGSWSAAMRIVGEQGAQGPAGAPGAAASLSTQYSVDGATNWHSTFNPGADLYMEVQIGSGGWSGPMRVVGAAGAPGSTGATGSQGIQGPAGSQGTQGIQGPAGANGATTYTWIKYGTSAAGASLQDSPTGMTYMGIAYNKLTPTESTTPSDYSWSLIQGAAGAAGSTGSTGSQGIQGPAGSNGAPTYTWIKYGSNSSGAGISDSPTGMTYMGIAYNKLAQTESVTPSDYSWSLIQGAAGAQGSQGSQGIQGIQGPQGPAGGLQTQVFFVAPTTPWNVGDMYWDGTGIMRRCISARGGSYTFAQYPGDWTNYSIKADYISANVAISAPTITGGTMSAPTITGGTITVGTLRTAASGERLEMSGSGVTGYIYYYPPSGASGGVWFSQGTLDEAVLQTSAISGKVAAVLDLRSAATIGTAAINADLTVNGAISQVGTRGCTLGGTLGVTGLLTPSGGIAGHTVSGTLTVTGSATVSGTLGVTGVLTAGGCDMSASASNVLIFKSSNGNIVKFNVNATGHLQRSIDGGAWALVGSTG